MNTYSVKQIADMLNTNPETVRRWIRDDKLKAVQSSRKDGNVVTEAELQRFLKATPKYMPRFAASLAAGLSIATPVITIPLLLGTVLGSKFLGKLEDKKKQDIRVSAADVETYLAEAISDQQRAISEKKEAIQKLENELLEDQQQLEQLKYLLSHKELFAKNDTEADVKSLATDSEE